MRFFYLQHRQIEKLAYLIRLIAAAPDLLEALWEILHTIRTFADASDPDITIEMIYELTTNALAKAEKERI